MAFKSKSEIAQKKFNLGPDRWPRESKNHVPDDFIREDLVGMRFGDLRIVSPWIDLVGRRLSREIMVKCECVTCGHRFNRYLKRIQKGTSNKCIACKKRMFGYPTWLYTRCVSIKSRCINPRVVSYKYYGGKGITFDFESPRSMAIWVAKNLGCGDEVKDLYLVRIDDSKAYCKDNMMWSETSKRSSIGIGKRKGQIIAFREAYPNVGYTDSTLYLKTVRLGMSWQEVDESWKRWAAKFERTKI